MIRPENLRPPIPGSIPGEYHKGTPPQFPLLGDCGGGLAPCPSTQESPGQGPRQKRRFSPAASVPRQRRKAGENGKRGRPQMPGARAGPPGGGGTGARWRNNGPQAARGRGPRGPLAVILLIIYPRSEGEAARRGGEGPPANISPAPGRHYGGCRAPRWYG